VTPRATFSPLGLGVALPSPARLYRLWTLRSRPACIDFGRCVLRSGRPWPWRAAASCWRWRSWWPWLPPQVLALVRSPSVYFSYMVHHVLVLAVSAQVSTTVYPSAAATAILNFASSSGNSYAGTPYCLSTFTYSGINHPGDNSLNAITARTACNLISSTNLTVATSTTVCLSSTSFCTTTSPLAATGCTNVGSATLGPFTRATLTCTLSGTYTGQLAPVGSGQYCTPGCWGPYYGQATPYHYNVPTITSGSVCNSYSSGCRTSGIYIGIGANNAASMYPYFSYSLAVRGPPLSHSAVGCRLRSMYSLFPFWVAGCGRARHHHLCDVGAPQADQPRWRRICPWLFHQRRVHRHLQRRVG
jgi:hypothetical protein